MTIKNLLISIGAFFALIIIFWIPFVLVGFYGLKWHGEWYSLPFFMTSFFTTLGSLVVFMALMFKLYDPD